MTKKQIDLPTGVHVVITILIVGASACSGSAATDTARTRPSPSATPTAVPAATSAQATPTERAATTPTPTVPDLALSAEAEHVVQLASRDLAGRLDVALDHMRLVSIEMVQWPDAGLGCPQPGMLYVQVLTPGFRVMLETAGQVYAYHTDRGQRVVMCKEESMSSSPTPLGQVEPGLERLAHQAREDLAHRLSIPVEQIEVLESKPVVWPDGGLGCPEPGLAYTQVPREGVLIRLLAKQRIYSYHGGAGTPPFLCQQATTDDAP